jgi:RNA polymerase sigma-70 factor (ECF subfamily)
MVEKWLSTHPHEERIAMTPENSFVELIARLQARDDDAATRVFQRFACRLIGLARLHLKGRLRQKVDPEDLLVSAFRSFVLRHAEGQFDLQGWDSLWALLSVITVRKCKRWSAHFHAKKRDIEREVRAGSGAEGSGAPELFAADPSPAEAAALADLVEQLLRELGKRNGEILSLALQGFSASEIANQLDRPTRIVRRVLERVKQRLQSMHSEPAGLA